jgi:ubiquinol-cytochrome c reductase subunit 7
MFFGPLGPSFAPYVRSSRTLSKWLKPIANWYANLSGYRRVGLVYDDLRASRSSSSLLAKLRIPPHHLSVLAKSVTKSSCLYLVVEERPDVQRVRWFSFSGSLSVSLLKRLFVQALTRLTPREAYDRAFRFKRASQASVQHKELPKSEWIHPEEVRGLVNTAARILIFRYFLRMFGI